MTQHFSPPSDIVPTVSVGTSQTFHPVQPASGPMAIFVEAVRCWRTARDRGDPVQPCLFRLLSPHDYGMLAPVLDSVMTLWEAVRGRDLDVGEPDGLSDDEHALLGLLDGTCQEPGGTGGMAVAFGCALCSARIMMAGGMRDDDPFRQSPAGTA